jgi:hypothetical protein
VVQAIVAGVDMHMPTKVVETIQDFLWVKLSLVRDIEEIPVPSPAKPTLSLDKLQKLLVQYGPAHFTNPIVYFQVLLLSQQFELVLPFFSFLFFFSFFFSLFQTHFSFRFLFLFFKQALKHLCSFELYFVDAVHFAITLYYYGLLHLNPAKPNGISFDFVALLQQYGAQFIGTDPVDVLQYLALLHGEEVNSVGRISDRGKCMKLLVASRPPQEYDFFFGVDDVIFKQAILSLSLSFFIFFFPLTLIFPRVEEWNCSKTAGD